MDGVKRILRSVAFVYFGLAVLFELFVWAYLLWGIQVTWLAWFVGVPQGLGVCAGCLLLFIMTILVKQRETQDSSRLPALAKKPSWVTVPCLITYLVLLNFIVSFFAFAAITSGDHGIPQGYNGRYVLAYRGEVIREIDEATYLQEVVLNRNRTMQLIAAVMLFFAWGIFANYLSEYG